LTEKLGYVAAALRPATARYQDRQRKSATCLMKAKPKDVGKAAIFSSFGFIRELSNNM